MAGYTRNDTGNNIADGNVINAADLDGEFDSIQTAFNETSGHTHDGTVGEGAPISVVGPAQDINVTITEVVPKTTNTMSLGTAALQFKDLYIDGTANIDSLVADTADINAGTIDGTTIGASTPAAITGTSITATGNIAVTGTVDGRDVATDGTKLDTIETNADVTDTANVTSAGALMDSELTNITAVKALDQGVATTDSPSFAGLTATTADINGGTIDGATIATSDITVGAGKTLDVSAGTLTLANDQISGDKVQGGTIGSTTITTLTGTTANVTNVNATTVDTANIEVANIKAKDGTAAATIADTTGVVTISSAVLTTADINGGTIDNTTIATSDITVGAGKTLDVSAGTLTLADDQISGDKIQGGTIGSTTITTLTGTTGNITNVNATTVDTTNIEVTNIKAKDGTASATIADSTGVMTVASSVLTTTDINGGTIDGVTIGGASAGAGTFTSVTGTSLDMNGDAVFNESGADVDFRIESDTNTHAFFLQGSDGNVGIGTSSPSNALDVNSGTSNIVASFRSTDANAQIRFYDDTTTGSFNSIGVSGDNLFIQAEDDILFKPNNGSESMRITSGGDVGIGTSSPDEKLHVSSSSATAAVFQRTGSSTNTSVIFRNTSGDIYAGHGIANTFVIGNAANLTSASNTFARFASDQVSLFSSGSESLRITSSGDVGIGTSSPSEPLHVVGTVRSDVSSTGDFNFTAVSTGGGQYRIYPDDATTANPTWLHQSNSGEDQAWVIGGVERLRITSSGDVGIGTDSPTSMLDVQEDAAFGGVASAAQVGATVSIRQPQAYDPSNGDATSAINIITQTTIADGSYMGGISWARMTSNGGTAAASISAIGETDSNTGLAFATGSSNTERMRIDSSGHAIIPGGVTLGTAAGVYDADKTLDDYEEGTWTPVISDGTNDGTSDVAVATYVKVGVHVHVQGRIRLSSLGSASGALRLTGLPFNSKTLTNNFGVMVVGRAAGLAVTAGQAVYGDLRSNVDYVNLIINDVAVGTSNLQDTEFTDDGDISFSMDYISN
jgi:hypothetical protein